MTDDETVGGMILDLMVHVSSRALKPNDLEIPVLTGPKGQPRTGAAIVVGNGGGAAGCLLWSPMRMLS